MILFCRLHVSVSILKLSCHEIKCNKLDQMWNIDFNTQVLLGEKLRTSDCLFVSVMKFPAGVSQNFHSSSGREETNRVEDEPRRET